MRCGIFYIALALLASGNLSFHRANEPRIEESPLCIAAGKKDINGVRAAFASGEDVNSLCKDGTTPLSMAVWSGDTQVIRLLLEQGANVNARYKDDLTALMAVMNGKLTDVMVLLLDRGAEVNAQDGGGRSALMLNAFNNRSDLVDILLSRGAQADLRDNNGSTAMMYTSSWEQYDFGFGQEGRSEQIVTSLVSHGAKPDAQNKKGMTALMYASGWRHSSVVKQLLKLGASLTIKDNLGRTALTWAARDGKEAPWVSPLLAAEASVDLIDLILLKEEDKALRAVRDKSSNLKGVGPYGESCLMAAAENNMPVVLEALLAHRADINATDDKGYTPILLAVGGRQRSVSINAGPKEWRKEGVDPKRARMVKLLLQNRSDAGIQLRGSSSALRLARELKDQGVIDILVAAGVKE